MGFEHFLQNAGAAFAGTAAALDEFGRDTAGPTLDHFSQHHLGPALEQTSAALHEFGEKQLGPAMEVAGAAICEFGEQKLIPALGHAYEETAKALDHFGQQHVGPALETTGAALHEFGETKLGPALAVTGAALHEFGEKQLSPALATTGQWIEKNPGQTAMIASSVVTLVIPGLISGPLLWIFGWGGNGVRAGSAAAAMQASLGNVAAGSAFATAQSSAMGGYGVAIVHGVLRAGAAVLGAAGLGSTNNATVVVEIEDISEDEEFFDVESDGE